jgi:hypothetical protein
MDCFVASLLARTYRYSFAFSRHDHRGPGAPGKTRLSTSVKLNKDTIFPSYTLVADRVFCDYDPTKKKADVGSNFLKRETF